MHVATVLQAIDRCKSTEWWHHGSKHEKKTESSRRGYAADSDSVTRLVRQRKCDYFKKREINSRSRSKRYLLKKKAIIIINNNNQRKKAEKKRITQHTDDDDQIPNPDHPFLPSHPLSDGHEQLAPTTHDEYPPDEQPYSRYDIDVPRELVGREDLRAQKARPRALVRVDERAAATARELRVGVVCGSGVGRCGAACHLLFFAAGAVGL